MRYRVTIKQYERYSSSFGEEHTHSIEDSYWEAVEVMCNLLKGWGCGEPYTINVRIQEERS